MKSVITTQAQLIMGLQETIQQLESTIHLLQNEQSEDKLVSVSESARILQCSRPTMYRHIERFSLTVFTVADSPIKLKYSDVVSLIKKVQFKSAKKTKV